MVYIINIMRYAYVVLHELSHLMVGLLMGCGCRELWLSGSEDGAGYYRPKYRSWFGYDFVNLGDAMMCIAGPILPPIIIKYLIDWILTGDYVKVYIVMGIFLFLAIVYSSQKFRFIVLGLFIYSGLVELQVLVLGVTVWFIVGLFIELVLVGKYNRKGSDMGQFVYNIIQLDSPVISWVLNKILQVYYIYMIYLIITRVSGIF